MPIPALAIAIVEVAVEAGVLAWRAWRLYEAAQTAAELAQLTKMIAQYKALLSKDVLEALKKEIDIKSSQLALLDEGGNTQEKRGNWQGTYTAFIERKIPFRFPISAIAKLANDAPITVPRKIKKKLGGLVDIDVRLRQYTASVCFETVDSILDWQCPLKPEMAFNPSTKTPYLGTPPTRPKRVEHLPYTFWPVPKGAIIPDLTIVEDRKKPAALMPPQQDNVFAVVEIKFPNDRVKEDQMDEYVQLFSKNRVALMRIPEDLHKSMRPKTPSGEDATQGKESDKKRPKGK